MFDTHWLEKSLDVASLRNQVIANNIANLNTPGFQGQAVLFEGELRQALDTGEAPETVQPQVVTESGRIDVNTQMANLAKNTIMYQALSTKISGIFGLWKWVVENSGR